MSAVELGPSPSPALFRSSSLSPATWNARPSPFEHKRILIATDAWFPQVNGVVRTLRSLSQVLEGWGYEVRFLTHETFRTFALPSYPEIRLALFAGLGVGRIIDEFKPHSIHIATEGPIGLAVRRFCLNRRLPFTTSFHTLFPEYIEARTGIPASWMYPLLRRFHGPSEAVMVATPTLERSLARYGFSKLKRWSRGVDTELFRPGRAPVVELPRPIFLYVGRVSVEKNVEAFLKLDLPGSKLVVGDGPQLCELKARYPAVHFAGAKFGEELAAHYATSDVLVFPSKTDTFGLVMLEALACGVPVAAFPVQGPIDVIGSQSGVGVLGEDMQQACVDALHINSSMCRLFALGHSWDACAQQFLSNLSWQPDASFASAASRV